MIDLPMGTFSNDLAGKPRPLEQARSVRPNPKADSVLLMWRRLVDHAVHDSMQTLHGLPTDVAILSRWWIGEHKPKQKDRVEWERSFECACHWLDEDVKVYRPQLLEKIDASLRDALIRHSQGVIYKRRAMVLTCAGFPTSIARQFVLPLVSKKDYEDVAGVDHGDKYVMYDRLEAAAA